MENAKNQDTKVIIEMPKEVRVRLVTVNELKQYEFFQWLAIFFAPIAVGFWTAYFSGNKDLELWWSALVFSLASGLFIVLAFIYRKKVFQSDIQKVASIKDFKNDFVDGYKTPEKGRSLDKSSKKNDKTKSNKNQKSTESPRI